MRIICTQANSWEAFRSVLKKIAQVNLEINSVHEKLFKNQGCFANLVQSFAGSFSWGKSIFISPSFSTMQ